MSKERLKEIKSKAIKQKVHVKQLGTRKSGYWTESYEVLKEDYEWLIEQAERVQELEVELYGNDIQMGYKRMYGQCNKDYAKLIQQNKRYREALEYYADEYEYHGHGEAFILRDEGSFARKALEESE